MFELSQPEDEDVMPAPFEPEPDFEALYGLEPELLEPEDEALYGLNAGEPEPNQEDGELGELAEALNLHREELLAEAGAARDPASQPTEDFLPCRLSASKRGPAASAVLAQALDFLRALGTGNGPGLTELRYISGQRCKQHFVQPSQLAAVVQELLARNAIEASTVLVGVNPRARAGGKDSDVAAVSAFVLDLDGGEGLQLEEQMRRVDAVHALAPAFASVRSGSNGHHHHHHVYFRLSEPVNPEQARALVRRFRRWLCADATEAPSHAARLLGSYNWKDGERKPVSLIYLAPGTSVSLAALSAALDALGVPQLDDAEPKRPRIALASSATAPSRGGIEGLSESIKAIIGTLSPRIRDLIASGNFKSYGYPSRSERDAAVALALVNAGASDEQIVEVFNETPVGSKVREAGAGYLLRTINFVRDKSAARDSLVLVEAATPGRRVLLTLRVLQGPFADRGSFTHGVNESSTSYPWLMKSAGLPADAAVEALIGKTLRVRLEEHTHEGKTRPQVRWWMPARPGEVK